MHALVVLCLSAAILGIRAAVLPAEETDLELKADDSDSGNWTANLGDMEVNIEHKHGDRAQNSSGSWTMDISRIKFQNQDNSDAEDSHEVEIEKTYTGPSEQNSNNEDAEDQSSNNEIDNDIPVDDFKTKDYDSYFPQPQMPLLRPEFRQLHLETMVKPFQPWLYGRPNLLYEMLPPKEEIMTSTPLYPLENYAQDLDVVTPKEEIMILPPHYLTDEQSQGSNVMLPEVDLLTLPSPYLDEQGEGSVDKGQQTEYQLLPYPIDQSHESIDESEDSDEIVLDPDGYEHFKGVGWFKLDSSNEDWHKARDACEAVGAHFANTIEHAKVFLKLLQRHPEIPVAAVLRYQEYIGVNDPEQERQFKTVQGKPDFQIWYLKDPDDADPEETCVRFHMQGRTIDVPCFYRLPFFCQKDIPVVI